MDNNTILLFSPLVVAILYGLFCVLRSKKPNEIVSKMIDATLIVYALPTVFIIVMGLFGPDNSQYPAIDNVEQAFEELKNKG